MHSKICQSSPKTQTFVAIHFYDIMEENYNAEKIDSNFV